MPTGSTSSPLPAYPATSLSRQLKVRLAPLDLTHRHNITGGQYRACATPIAKAGSPLAEWLTAILSHTFKTLDLLHPGHGGDKAETSLHDPVCVWYALTSSSSSSSEQQWMMKTDVDVRVETMGQWTRGMCVVDRRSRKRRDNDDVEPNDDGQWLGKLSGNRLDVLEGAPAGEELADIMMRRIFADVS